MIMWLYSEYGTFNTYRNMNSYMGHAHKWMMPDGSFKYVHMYLSADAGYDFATDEQMRHTSSVDPDHATRDLYNAIENGDHPTWTAYVQVIDPRDTTKFEYNILDLTKHWDMGTYPKNLGTVGARPFGKLTLNRNPQNYFAEIEQLAFSPSHLVPGIQPSEDPMLQARMFAYPDAQRYRLGVNYQQIPVNQSKYAFNPLLRDGAATVNGNYGSLPGYVTNSHPMTFAERSERALEHNTWIAKVSTEPFVAISEVDYIFPRTFWTHLNDPQYPGWQQKMIRNLSKSVASARKEIREKVYNTFRLVHPEFAILVREATERRVPEDGKVLKGPHGCLKL